LEPSKTDLAKSYDHARLLTLAAVIVLALIFLLLAMFKLNGNVDVLALRLGMSQDLVLLPVFVGAALLTPKLNNSSEEPRWPQLGWRAIVLVIAATVIVGVEGHYWVFQNYDLSRDEQMATFDQAIYGGRRLLWPIAADWRAFVDALNTRFVMVIGDREFWASGYSPINAAFRALVGTIADPALASPLMVAVGAFSIWKIAKLIWPDSRDTSALAVVFLLTSSQVVITSMTAFAMSMHLGLNLLWLWLFLIDRPLARAGVLAVGFLATGIHQPLFHPLFVLPFLLLFVGRKQWQTLLIYLIGYAFIALFWSAWPVWLAAQGSDAPAVADCGRDCLVGTHIGRFFTMATALDLNHIWLTTANLLRFLCWQHPLLVPLSLFGAISCWRADPFVRCLALGFALPVVLIAILLPWQGHGWGYRYLHPVLGNAVLLACFGWRRLAQGGLSMRQPFVITTAAALILLPIHAAMAARLVLPSAQIHSELMAIDADVVIVDTELSPFGSDVVFNSPDLSQRPKLLLADLTQPESVAILCRNSTIAFVDAPKLSSLNRFYGWPEPTVSTPQFRRLYEIARQSNCRTTAVQTIR
jgi:hypothetical protein